MSRVSNDMWPEESVAIIRKMWLDGCSAGVIAAEVGRSRSAVLGKLMRLGITRSSGNPIQTHRAPRVSANPRPRVKKVAARPVVDIVAALGLEPLGAGPIAEPGCCKFLAMDWDRCCGRPIERAGARYCDPHHAVAHRPKEAA